ISPARSATLRPCFAVVLAAAALALAASRVLFCAVVRVRRPVVFVGDLRAVERVVVREAVPREALRVAAPLRPAALRFAEVLLLVVPLLAVEFVVVAMLMVSPSRVASQGNDISS